MFDWRAGILLLAGLALLYLLLTVFRLLRSIKRSATVPAPATPGSTGGFGERLAEQVSRIELEQEVRRLREDVDALRSQLAELRAARNVSPHYAEAADLFGRGFSPREVADRMGISLAEAELVFALRRGEKLFEENERANDDIAGGKLGGR